MAWQTPKTNWKTGDIPLAGDFNRIEQNIQELENTKETPSGAQAKVDTHASSKQTHGISGGYYIAKTSRSDQLPDWNDIQGKPDLALAADLAAHLADNTKHVTKDGTLQVNLNSEMLNGLRANQFAKTRGYLTATELNDARYLESGFYTISNTEAPNIGLPAQWFHIINLKHFTEDGFNAQIALQLDGGLGPRPMYVRFSANGSWTQWYKIYHEGILPWARNIHAQTVDPLPEHGADGDVWLKYL